MDVAFRNEELQRRRREWIESQGGRCVKCGSTRQLEVDHKDRSTKSMDPTNIWGLSKEKRELELAKCQVLCWECHYKKTFEEMGYKEHGSDHSYTRKGCRCAECREAHRIHNKAWRERRASRLNQSAVLINGAG